MVKHAAAHLSADEADLVARARQGDAAAVRHIIRQHNQRLYRIARSIVRDDAEAEDVLQEAYVRAFQHLGRLEDPSAFAAWLSRIVIHESKARLRRSRAGREIAAIHAGMKRMAAPDPEEQALARQLQTVLAAAIDALPLGYQTVFVLREVEGLDTKEVSAVLGIREQAVKTRLHRARAALRNDLHARIGAAAPPFRFDGERCDRLVATVLRRIAGRRDRST